MKKRIYCVISMILLAAMLFGACGGSSQPGSTASASPGTSGSSQTGSTGGDQIKDVPREKTVVFENIEGRVPLPDNQNPYTDNQYLDWGMWQANQESLFYYNYETGEIMPWQAKGYEFNDDFTKVKIFIREGVKWQDGEPFTADDVVFTINMIKSHPELRYSTDMNTYVQDVVANNDHEVEFTLTQSYPSFVMDYFSVKVWDTLLIAPEHIWKDVDPVTFSNYDLAKGYPVGTGPYKLVRSTETEQVYDRCDTWWGAETGFMDMPKPERAIWVTVGSEELRAAKLVSNEIDAAWTLGRSNYETAKAKNNNIVSWYEDLPYAYLDPGARGLYFNCDVFPFNDPDVRHAINHAINRDEIVAIAYEGMTEPSYTMYPTYPPLKAFLDRNEDLFEKYDIKSYDVQKCKDIMTSKGFTLDSEGLWRDSGGNRITFTIIARSGESDKVKVGPILVQQLRQAGFDVDFQALESAMYYNETQSGSAVVWLSDQLSSVSDPYSMLDAFHSKWYKPVGELSSKPSRYRNSEFDALVEQMSVLAPSDPRFMELADQAFEIWLRDLPCIGLVQAYLLTPFNSTYWTNWPDANNNYIHPGHWWVTGNILLHNIEPAK